MRETWARRPGVPIRRWDVPAGNEEPAHVPALEWVPALYERGVITWGWIVIGFGSPWQPGTGTTPGIVLWSSSRRAEEDPGRFELVARRYWLLRKGRNEVPGLQRLAAWAAATHAPQSRQRVPPLLGEGSILWADPIRIRRGHLPGGRLAPELLPIVRFPHVDEPGVTILPHWFWPDSYTALWSADRPSE